MTSVLSYLYVILPFTTTIIAYMNLKKYSSSTERYFLHFFCVMTIVESIGLFGYLFNLNVSWAYIIYIMVSFLFYFGWYCSILKNILNKRVVIVLTVIFFFVGVFNSVSRDWDTYHHDTFICGSIITIIASLLYFSELLRSDDISIVKHNLRFWIATGLLLFNVGVTPIMLFYNKVTYIDHSVARIIMLCLNITLYTCFSIGFIWSTKK